MLPERGGFAPCGDGERPAASNHYNRGRGFGFAVKRNAIVLLMMVTGLGLMIWAGVENYSARQQDDVKVQSLEAELHQIETQADSAHVGTDATQAPDTPLLGEQAPDFTLTSLDGKKVSLKSYRGKAVIVDFWATWCGPCRVEIPWFEDFRQQYGPQGLAVLGVSTDQLDDSDPAKAHQVVTDFAKQIHMNYPVLMATDSVEQQYGGISALPTTFFINRSGQVVASTIGLAPHSVIEADIKKALGTGGNA